MLRDAWAEPDGCWADEWYPELDEFMACNRRPAEGSGVGLCPKHVAMMRKRADASSAR